jgi:hypothetical protein
MIIGVIVLVEESLLFGFGNLPEVLLVGFFSVL